MQDSATRSISARQQPNLVIPTEAGVNTLVSCGGYPNPLAFFSLRPDENLPLVSITALDAIHHPSVVRGALEYVLSNLVVRENPCQLDCVAWTRGIKFVEPNLLVELQILVGTLAGVRELYVPEA
jgi:hypothetical protein